ncbi:MAG: dipeptide ABC transporter ATP-binding protein [Limnohabitans sp.]
MNPKTSSLHVQDLCIRLHTESGVARAVEHLSLSIDRGETFALVGESGCGKSMTAMALLRLLPDNGEISRGAVRLRDLDVLDQTEQAMQKVRGRRMAIIFQEPATSLNPVMTIGAQLREVLHLHTPLRGQASSDRALQWLERVGLPEPQRRMAAYPFELSGGQLQRVMIAMALAAEPDLLIADEPTTALDVTIQAQILQLLRDLQRERGMAMLMITHDLAVVQGMSHHVALMYAGQIVESARTEDFFARPRHPYAQLLLKALPGQRLRGQSLAAIVGTVPPMTEAFAGCRFAPRCPHRQDDCVRQAIELSGMDHQVRCLHPGQALVQPVPAMAPGVSPAPAALDDEPVLDVRGLCVDYETGGTLLGGRTVFSAVRAVDLQIAAGETLALVGESGCGKTTLGKALLRLLDGRARVQGQALLHGQDLLTMRGKALHQARGDIQIVFQNPFASLNPRMRVREVLEEGMVSLRPQWSGAERESRLQELLAQVGLRPDALHRYPHELSGGQRQRIAIARALAVGPRLIVCDEPTSALDVSVQAQILNLLKDLQSNLGVSYLFVTHNIGVVEYLADRVAVMQAGQIVETGSAQEVLDAPQQAYTRTLLDSVPRLTLQ